MRRPVLAALGLVSVFSAACYAPCARPGTPLLGGLLSQQSPEQAQQALGAGTRWVAERQEGPKDSRPRFDFLLVDIGSRTDLGVPGRVKLWFFNDRLYTVFFTPDRPDEYMRAVKALPGARVDHQSVIHLPDRTGVWQVGAPADAPSVEWYDECLREEHDGWIMKYSAVGSSRPTTG